MTVGPNPFSREGSQPGDGLGEANRFETLADGSTPQAVGSTSPSPATAPAAGGSGGQPTEPRPTIAHPEPSGFIAADPYAPPPPSAQWGTSTFPTYDPYAASGQALQPTPPQAGPYPVPAYPDQAYPGQVYPGQAYGPILQHSPYATVSLVTGIIGVFCGITGPLAIGFGVAALRQISNEPRTYGGRGVAIAGLVTGIVGSLWLLLYLLAIVGS